MKKFVIRIDIAEVEECNVISVPTPSFLDEPNELQEFSRDYLLQMSLIGLGKKLIYNYDLT